MVKKSDSCIKSVSNLTLHASHVVVAVNPKIYPLDIIYSAAYVFLDRAFVVIDGDPGRQVLVELRPKVAATDIEQLGTDFNAELLNYAVFAFQKEKAREIRDYIIRRAMETIREAPSERYLDDPEGIAIPWEERRADDRS